MNDQELKSLEELHLCTASLHHVSAAVLPETTSDSLEKHTAALGNCTKRHSCCSRSQFRDAHPRKAALYPTSPPCATNAADHPIHFFTKLQLPHSFITASQPPFRHSPSAVSLSAPLPQMPEFPNTNLVQDSTQFPNAARVLPNSVFNHQAAAEAGITPLRPPVGRNTSRSPSCGESPSSKRLRRMREILADPNSVFNRQAAAEAGITPLRPPAGRNASRSPRCGESPSSKRLKRILKEIRQMCAQVEGEDVDEDNNLKEESENQVEVPSQEAVWVEKIGSSLVLHFKCPCGKGYRFCFLGRTATTI